MKKNNHLYFCCKLLTLTLVLILEALKLVFTYDKLLEMFDFLK
jgi:hypothetical protein